MVVERICPICHLRIWSGQPPKWKERCMGHDLDELLEAPSEVQLLSE